MSTHIIHHSTHLELMPLTSDSTPCVDHPRAERMPCSQSPWAEKSVVILPSASGFPSSGLGDGSLRANGLDRTWVAAAPCLRPGAFLRPVRVQKIAASSATVVNSDSMTIMCYILRSCMLYVVPPVVLSLTSVSRLVLVPDNPKFKRVKTVPSDGQR